MRLSKETIANSKRLSNLEKEMAFLIAKKGHRISLKNLKSKFYRRASLDTTKAITAASELFYVDNEYISLDDSDGPTAIIDYKTSGKIDYLRIGGKNCRLPSGTKFGISVDSDDMFRLEVETGLVDKWSFETTEILITEEGITREREENVDLEDKQGDFDEYV